jgi:hypothetical protein
MKNNMPNMPNTLFMDDYEMLIVVKINHLPSDEYSTFEVAIDKPSRIIHTNANFTNDDETILLNETLDDSKVIEIKRLVSNIKLPLVTHENKQFICDGSSIDIEIFSNYFNFDASWSDEDKQEAYLPLKALADYVFSLANTDLDN